MICKKNLGYDEIRFKNKKETTAYKKKFKKKYGYTPTTFTIVNTNGKIIGYTIIKPKQLIPL